MLFWKLKTMFAALDFPIVENNKQKKQALFDNFDLFQKTNQKHTHTQLFAFILFVNFGRIQHFKGKIWNFGNTIVFKTWKLLSLQKTTSCFHLTEPAHHNTCSKPWSISLLENVDLLKPKQFIFLDKYIGVVYSRAIIRIQHG